VPFAGLPAYASPQSLYCPIDLRMEK